MLQVATQLRASSALRGAAGSQQFPDLLTCHFHIPRADSIVELLLSLPGRVNAAWSLVHRCSSPCSGAGAWADGPPAAGGGLLRSHARAAGDAGCACRLQDPPTPPHFSPQAAGCKCHAQVMYTCTCRLQNCATHAGFLNMNLLAANTMHLACVCTPPCILSRSVSSLACSELSRAASHACPVMQWSGRNSMSSRHDGPQRWRGCKTRVPLPACTLVTAPCCVTVTCLGLLRGWSWCTGWRWCRHVFRLPASAQRRILQV